MFTGTRRARLITLGILAALLVVVRVVAAFDDEFASWIIGLGLVFTATALLFELGLFLFMRFVARLIARVRAETGAPIAAVLAVLSAKERANLAALIGASVPKDGQVVIAPTPEALQVWTLDTTSVPIVAVPWQRLGPISVSGTVGLALPGADFAFVSNERQHGVARVALILEGDEIGTRAQATEFLAAFDRIRPPIA